MSNRLPWLRLDDYVAVDPGWFVERDYRTRKSLNDIVYMDATSTLLRVVYVSPQGQSAKLKRTYESKRRWVREHPLYVQVAHHSDVNPITFSSRRLKRDDVGVYP